MIPPALAGGVSFSMVTQHGRNGASNVIHNALGDDVSNMSDEDIINKIYDERSKVEYYFKSSSQNIKNNLKYIRFPQERAKALELLNIFEY